MALYIVLRLTPPTAVDAATFTGYLNNLNITVSDISDDHAASGVLVGAAVFAPPTFPPPAATRIVQHEILGVLQSVATALIEYIPPDPEYITPDLLINFGWGAGRTRHRSCIMTLHSMTSRDRFPRPARSKGLPIAVSARSLR
jgi:hypothetical protein